jgi:hypothetical protein
MRFRGGEFSTGTTGNFQSELTLGEDSRNRQRLGFGSVDLLEHHDYAHLERARHFPVFLRARGRYKVVDIAPSSAFPWS